MLPLKARKDFEFKERAGNKSLKFIQLNAQFYAQVANPKGVVRLESGNSENKLVGTFFSVSKFIASEDCSI